jgi:hypothetical protein
MVSVFFSDPTIAEPAQFVARAADLFCRAPKVHVRSHAKRRIRTKFASVSATFQQHELDVRLFEPMRNLIEGRIKSPSPCCGVSVVLIYAGLHPIWKLRSTQIREGKRELSRVTESKQFVPVIETQRPDSGRALTGKL